MADPVPTRKGHELHTRRDGGWSETVKFIDLGDGNELEVRICTECHLITAKCDHHKCTWGHRDDCTGFNPSEIVDWLEEKPCEGCKLTCDFCGIDGT